MNIYQPNFVYKNIFEIDYKTLYNKGIKLLIFDLDNTIASYQEKTANKEILELFQKLKKQFQIVILSNSLKKRVLSFAKRLDVDYKAFALKPLTINYKKIINKYKKNTKEVAIIGDHLFTDVKGGNKVGIYTILVNPLTNYDPIFSRLSRHLEEKIKKKLGIE